MPPRPLVRQRSVALVLVGVTLVAAVSACAEPGMTLEAWEEVWRETVQRVARTEAEEIPQETCAEILTFLRERRPELKPLPVRGVEKPLNSWFELAQASFFECPPDGEQVKGWPAAFERLRVIEAEIDTVLERGRQPDELD